MSGLEPLAALGLACNIMQLLSFGGESISLCRRIYDTGQPDPSLDRYCQEIAQISNSLKNGLTAKVGDLPTDDVALLEATERSIDVADKLAQELQDISTAGQQKLLKSIRLSFKTMRRKSQMERLEKSLKGLQSIMDTRMLVKILDRVDASATQREASLTELRSLLEKTFQQFSAQHKNLSDSIANRSLEASNQVLQAVSNAQSRIEEHIKAESSRNNELIQTQIATVAGQAQQNSTNFEEWRDANTENRAYERLLKSLRFDSMEERKNQISENCPDTYLWIFESQESDNRSDTRSTGEEKRRPGSAVRQWDNFVVWLKSENTRYWVSGKPGSGKSTLMKFISSNPKTQAALNEWRPNVRILFHYFWKAGSQRQQDIKGFLCSVIYQIFSQERSAALAYLQESPDVARSTLSKMDWDMARLKGLLLSCIGHSKKSTCIFIDGLDEITPQNDIYDLLSILDSLALPNVKICVSSRPEQVFQNHLRHHPTLRMQDLTCHDMKKCSREILGRAVSPTHQAMDKEELMEIIVCNADGVFLWVVLVSKSLARGIENGDTYPELMQRLGSTPTDLMALYNDMWLRSNEDYEIYKKTTSLLLSTVIAAASDKHHFMAYKHYAGPSIFELMASMEPLLLDRFLENSSKPSEECLERKCRYVEESIKARSAGLLEMAPVPVLWRGAPSPFPQRPSRKHGSLITFANQTVRFVHRTALDFLTDTEDGRTLWQTSGIPMHEICARLMKATLLLHHIWPLTYDLMFGSAGSVEFFIEGIFSMWKEYRTDQTDLLLMVEKVQGRGGIFPYSFLLGPEDTTAQFLTCAALGGFFEYVILRIFGPQPEEKALERAHSVLLQLCDFGALEEATKGTSIRYPLIRHLLMQSASPNPTRTQNFENPTTEGLSDALNSPWLRYLGSVIYQLLSEPRRNPGLCYNHCLEILQTLRTFIQRGASLNGHVLLFMSQLHDTPFRVRVVVERQRRFEHGFYFKVNIPFLIQAILCHLPPVPIATDLGHEQERLDAEAAMICLPGKEACSDGRSHYVLQCKDESKRVMDIASRYLLNPAGSDLKAKESLASTVGEELNEVVAHTKSRLKPAKKEEA